MNKETNKQVYMANPEELGLYIGRYIQELCVLEPTQLHFFTPLSLLELLSTKFHYNALKEYKLLEVVNLAKEYIPAFLRKKQVKIIYE